MVALILLGAGLVLLVLLSVSYIAQRRSILANASREGSTLAQSVVYQIESELGRAEALVQQTAILLTDRTLGRVECAKVIRDTLQAHPSILGMAVANSETEAKKGDFKILYGWHDAGAVTVHDRESPLLDYQHDWFYLPYHLQVPVWIEPYYDFDAGTTMVTYSVPVVRAGEVTAVVTCDLSLDAIHALLDTLPLGDGGMAILLSRRGTYVAHPEHRLEMKETVFSLAESLKDETSAKTLRQLGHDMLGGTPGQLYCKHPTDGEQACIFYHTVPSTGWALGIIRPEKQVMAPLVRLNRMSVTVAFSGLALLLIPALAIAWSVASPLRRLADAAQLLATGDFETPLPSLRTGDEVSQLTGAFEQMRHDLRRYIADLTATTAVKERMAGELSAAREVQMSIVPKLFPPFPERSEIDLYAVLIPAREVGGDLYDFAQLDEDHLYIAIGDVSGKGIPASLLMAVGKTLLKSAVQTLRAPGRALSQVNNELSEDNETCMFITMFCGILNIKTGDFIYSNAGHNAPFLTRHSGEVERLNEPPGLPLGIQADTVYHDHVCRLDTGNLLVLYTDGVTEAMNPANEMFGDRGLLKYIQRERHQSARAFVEGLGRAVHEHADGADQSDDVTALAVRCRSWRAQMQRASQPAETFGRAPGATLSLQNNLEQLAHLAVWTQAQATALNIPPDLLRKINLALEEWLVNIISYAYTDTSEHTIELRLWHSADEIIIDVMDDGQPFDPTAQAEVDISMPLEHRRIGGLGVHFIRKTMDRFAYRRENGCNIVTLAKNITGESA
jgi:sigma-B regulation protein RsbU (phosphoserine phosphatase)